MSDLTLFQGEDVLRALFTAGTDIQALASVFRNSGHWEEVVPGMRDLCVKYDPATMSGEEAEAHFRNLWDQPLPPPTGKACSMILDASFADAPDTGMVAKHLGISAEQLPQWLCARQYRVTMMGFQPGFAYLEDASDDDLPTIPRLSTPRQHVAAGSIGFLGKRACIYALDGPGGWPIIGRVSEALFRRDDPQPFLLQPGQLVSFRTL